jgi:hypothetical protein
MPGMMDEMEGINFLIFVKIKPLKLEVKFLMPKKLELQRTPLAKSVAMLVTSQN